MMVEEAEINRLFKVLLKTPRELFPVPRAALKAPKKQGVYIIYSPHHRVLHVGMTPRAKGGIAQRLKGHMAGNSSFTNTYLKGNGNWLRARCTFRCLVVTNRRKRVLLEALAIGRLCPAHIGHGSKLPA